MSKSAILSRRDLLKAGVGISAVATASLLPEKVKAEERIPRWAMVIDLRRCIGCRACTIACKSEYNVALGRWNAVVKNVEWGKYPNPQKHFLPRLCNHCAGDAEKKEWQVPPCVEKCPEAKSGKRMKMGGVTYRTGATYRRPDGMVLLDMSLCIGCYKCIDACPYGVRSIDPNAKLTRPDRERDVGVGKCSFCQHRVDNGVVPACVNTCPGEARIFGDLNDPDSEVSKLVRKFKLLEKRETTTLLPEERTMPYVFYIDPHGVLARYKIKKETKGKEFRDQFEG